MTNLPQVQGNFQTMSSREIATLCEKEHRHVLRDIDNLNETYEKMGLPKVGQGYYTTPNTGNQQYREYLLTKEQCIDLITGYRADVRIRINRRWQELEKAISLVLPDFSNPAEAARAWAAEFEKREQAEKAKIALEQQASINAPKVAHYDRVVARTNLVNATHVASKLKLSAVKLNRHLCELGVYNQAVKRGKVFNTWFIDKGYGEMKQTELGYDQALFTHAGEMWVIEMMISEGVVG